MWSKNIFFIQLLEVESHGNTKFGVWVDVNQNFLAPKFMMSS